MYGILGRVDPNAPAAPRKAIRRASPSDAGTSNPIGYCLGLASSVIAFCAIVAGVMTIRTVCFPSDLGEFGSAIDAGLFIASLWFAMWVTLGYWYSLERLQKTGKATNDA